MTRAKLGDRSLFPDLEAKSYLAHAAISPLSLPVRERLELAMTRFARSGLGGFGLELQERAKLKESLARLIGAHPEDLGFVQSTTPGIVWLAFAIDWKPRERVLLFEGEFPANVTPWHQAARTFDLETKTLPIAPFHESLEAGLASVEAELKQGARLIAVSAVRFQDGLRMPIAHLGALAHRYGAELFVDGIQGLGVAPVTVENVDYLASGAHKFLMGLDGAGFLYVARSRIGAIVPRLAGWLGHEDALSFLFEGPGHLREGRPFRVAANVTEQGALSSASCAALQASLGLIEELGVDAIFAHVQAFHDALEPHLAELGLESLRAKEPEGRSGSLCVRGPERDLAALDEQLRARGIAISTPDGNLRFAPHWPNALEEVPLVVDALRSALG